MKKKKKRNRKAHISIFFVFQFVNVLPPDNFNLYTNMSNLHKGTIKGLTMNTWTLKSLQKKFCPFHSSLSFKKAASFTKQALIFKKDAQKIQHFMNESSDFVKRKSVKEMYKIELIQMSEIETSFFLYRRHHFDNVKSYFFKVPIFYTFYCISFRFNFIDKRSIYNFN